MVDWKKYARYTVVTVNVIFLFLGAVVTGFGVYGWQEARKLEDKASIFKEMNAQLIAEFLACTGIITMATSMLGCLGAWQRWHTCIKAYAIILFAVCAVQMAMGAYLLTLSPDKLRDIWFTDTTRGEQLRQEYQNYMECCGFEYITDSQPETDCAGGYTIACKQQTINKIKDYIAPAAVAGVTIAVIELISLAATCAIIMTRSADVVDASDDPFAY